MPDFSQAATDLQPPTVIDHILLPVADLEAAARHMQERDGLQALEGGRHASGGTANYIVPLGRQYLELIAVVAPDEVNDGHLGARVQEAVRDGRTFVAWALRTTDLDALRNRLLGAGWELPPMSEGSRVRPDGRLLSWRTQDVATGDGSAAIPFVIEWKVPDGLHPGEMEAAHATGPVSVQRVVVGAREPDLVRNRLASLLGDSDMYEVRWAGHDGVEALVLEHSGGEKLVIR